MTILNLSEHLKSSTLSIHKRVEGHAFVKYLLQGKIDKSIYISYLLHLYSLYGTLESCLEIHQNHPAIQGICFPFQLFRTPSLKQDLIYYTGSNPILESNFISLHLQSISKTKPHLLAAWAYVRYLGDLSGGQILSKKIQKYYSHDGNQGIEFYEFDFKNIKEFKNLFKNRLDEIPPMYHQEIIQEAYYAFECMEQLFTLMCGVVDVEL